MDFLEMAFLVGFKQSNDRGHQDRTTMTHSHMPLSEICDPSCYWSQKSFTRDMTHKYLTQTRHITHSHV